ncbi:MAG: hypothetical protein F6K56_20255 [Moorea sp. SIO3G5]|nr:hypothetical protein [Moorena sp. SIO3G5]
MGRWGVGEMGRWGDGENCNRSNRQDACSTKLIAATGKMPILPRWLIYQDASLKYHH